MLPNHPSKSVPLYQAAFISCDHLDFNLELGVALVFNLHCWAIFWNNALIYQASEIINFHPLSSLNRKLSFLLCGGTVYSKYIARGSLKLSITLSLGMRWLDSPCVLAGLCKFWQCWISLTFAYTFRQVDSPHGLECFNVKSKSLWNVFLVESG